MSETLRYEPKSKDGRTPCYVCGDLVRLLERRQEAETRHRGPEDDMAHCGIVRSVSLRGSASKELEETVVAPV